MNNLDLYDAIANVDEKYLDKVVTGIENKRKASVKAVYLKATPHN